MRIVLNFIVVLAVAACVLLTACSKHLQAPDLTGRWQLIGSNVLGGPTVPGGSDAVVLELRFPGTYDYTKNGSRAESGLYSTSVTVAGNYRDTVLTLVHDDTRYQQSVHFSNGYMYLSNNAWSEGDATVFKKL